jgi:hypothetical protein
MNPFLKKNGFLFGNFIQNRYVCSANELRDEQNIFAVLTNVFVNADVSGNSNSTLLLRQKNF